MAKGVWVGIAVGAIALAAGLAYLWADALASLKYARQGEDEGFEQIGLMKSLLPIANQAANIEDFAARVRQQFPQALVSRKGSVVWIGSTGVRFDGSKIVAVLDFGASDPDFDARDP